MIDENMGEGNITVTAINGKGETADLTISPEVQEEAKNAGYVSGAAKKPAKKKKAAKKNDAEPPQRESVQFVGKISRWNKKANKQERVLRESPEFIIDGREKIMLPKDLHKTAAMFDVETARRVRNLFPGDFKTPVVK